MKLIKPLILMLLFFTSCRQPSKDESSKKDPSSDVLTHKMVTLNGYTFQEAETMVRSFIDDPFSSDSATSFWFKKEYVNKLAEVLASENADGFRIYYGKHGGKNQIVIVGTKPTKNRHPTKPGMTHRDFFTYTNSNYIQAGKAELVGQPEYGVRKDRLYTRQSSSCKPHLCRSENAITCDTAISWVGKAITDSITNTSLWYPRAFVEFLSDELNAAASQGKNPDGIRIYFARNDDDSHVFVFTTTWRGKLDYSECHLDKANQKKYHDKGDFDNGEECPLICNDVTWQ